MSLTLLAAVLLTAPNPDLRIEMRKGYWDARLKLAKIAGTSDLAKHAAQIIREQEGLKFNLFMKDARRIQREFRESNHRAELAYDTSSEVKLNDGKVISVLVSSYTYLGGAHGMSFCRTFNFGMVNGKPKGLSLAELVGKGNIPKVQLLLLEKFLADKNVQWADEGWITELTPAQLNRFWIHGKGLTWEFDPYELASYAMGRFTFSLTWADLKPLLRSGSPVGHLAR